MSELARQWRTIRSLAPVRFLLAGGANTLATYLLYLVLLTFLPYRISYGLAYVAGLFLAYVLNRVFVFNEHRGTRSIALLPLVYLAQYLLGAGIMHVWIELLGQSERIGPLVAVAATVPATYFLSKLAFVKGTGS
jgi:putative flippase GtrA